MWRGSIERPRLQQTLCWLSCSHWQRQPHWQDRQKGRARISTFGANSRQMRRIANRSAHQNPVAFATTEMQSTAQRAQLFQPGQTTSLDDCLRASRREAHKTRLLSLAKKERQLEVLKVFEEGPGREKATPFHSDSTTAWVVSGGLAPSSFTNRHSSTAPPQSTGCHHPSSSLGKLCEDHKPCNLLGEGVGQQTPSCAPRGLCTSSEQDSRQEAMLGCRHLHLLWWWQGAE